MGDYEIGKLRKELNRKTQLLRDEQRDHEETERLLALAQAERDNFHQELSIARQALENVDKIIAQNVKQMQMKNERENSERFGESERLKQRLHEQKNLSKHLEEEVRKKDGVIAELSLRLREAAKKYQDSSLAVKEKEVTEQVIITHDQFYRLTEKYNKLAADAENILAENKILRKLNFVPDNFGFDLEEIKIAEKQQLEDYKSQCRRLEAEVEELEAERTQLRYRIRQFNTLYATKGERYKDMTPRQLDLLDQYALKMKEGIIQQPQIDKTHKEMQKEIFKLRGQIEILQSRNPMRGGDGGMAEAVKSMQQQMKSVLEPLVQDMKRIAVNRDNPSMHNGSRIFVSGANLKEDSKDKDNNSEFRPPMPLPIAHNDWSKIKEGYSYAFASKIPVNIAEDDSDYDKMKVRYEVAALQLQNMESIKLLKEKQMREDKLAAQLRQLNDKYAKCLEVQDQLFLKYFVEKAKIGQGSKKLEIQKEKIKHQKEVLKTQYSTIYQAYQNLSKKQPLEAKYSDLVSRFSISQGQLLRLKRKYTILQEQMGILKHSYTNLESKSAENEQNLQNKLGLSRKNETELTSLLSRIIEKTAGMVSQQTHSTLLAKQQLIKARTLTNASKQLQLRLKVSKLESVEREMNIKDEIIQTLRENVLEVELQSEIIRSRLQSVDISYRSYRATFQKFVAYVNSNGISLMALFKKFDKDNSGQLGKQQFSTALQSIGFPANAQDVNQMFLQFDIDGGGTISYKQFMRKLRRSGVTTRTRQQQGLYNLFKAIKQAKITVRKAFQIIDADGSNSVTKGQMQRAFRKIGIEVTSTTIDFIFRASTSNSQISCSQFEKLFQDVVKQTSLEEQQLITTQLDWKLQFVLKLQQCSKKHHSSLRETFGVLDSDGNATLSIKQLQQFIHKAGITLQQHRLMELFQFLDRRRDQSVQYAQFLKVLEEAHAEQRRIQRVQAVKLRAEQLKKEYSVANIAINKPSEEVSLKVRIMGMEAKQSAVIKKNQRLVKTLVVAEQQIIQLKQSLSETQNQLIKVKEEYFGEKEKSIAMKERNKNVLSMEESRSTMVEIQLMKTMNVELKTDLDRSKLLFESTCHRNKAQTLKLGKIEAERDKYADIVKQLQSNSDLNAMFGVKTIEVEYSKRNQEIVNGKYQHIVDEMRKINYENSKLRNENLDKQKQVVKLYMTMQDKIQSQQKSINELSSKLLPTVSASKIEEILFKMREISASKSGLQQQNRELREKNFTLILRNDRLQNEHLFVEELQRKLRRTYTDQSSVAIIDLTKKLSDYKMGESKAKRQCALLKQKEQYYTRVHNADDQTIKQLENNNAKWETDFNKRQQFWRNSLAQQSKALKQLQNQLTKTKEDQQNAASFFNAKQQQSSINQKKLQSLPQNRQSQIKGLLRRDSAANSIESRGKMRQLQQKLLQKQKQIYQLKSALKDIIPQAKLMQVGSQMNVSSHSFVLQTDLSSSQLKNNARRFLNSQKEQEQYYKDEAARLTLAAQQSIDTLQRIIDDKNEQLRRKERQIEELKREYLRSKEEDFKQIQQLREKINSQETVTTQKSFYKTAQKTMNKFDTRNDNKIQLLLEAGAEKDHKIRELEEKLRQRKQVKERKEQSPKKTLKVDDDREKRRHIEIEEELKGQIKNIEKKCRKKDQLVVFLQNGIRDLKELATEEMKAVKDQQVTNMFNQLKNHIKSGVNANASLMEVHLQKLLEKMASLIKKNKAAEDQIKRLTQNKFGKTFIK